MHARETASSIFMLMVAVVFWLGADAIPSSPLEGSVGAAGFPKLLAVSLGALALIRIAQIVVTARRARRAGEKIFPAAGAGHLDDGGGRVVAAWHEHKRAAGMLALGIFYVLLLPILGYPLSIALLVGAIALYSGRRPSLGLAVVVVAGTAGLYGIFVWLLDVPMPMGIWGKLVVG